MTQNTGELTLYDRIGGEPAVRAAVDRFYERVLADPELAGFFSGISMPRLKAHQFAFFSQVIGGPRQYSGATMQHAHSRLAIEQRQFNAVAGHLVQSLRDLIVSEEIIASVAAAVVPLAPQIVNQSQKSVS